MNAYYNMMLYKSGFVPLDIDPDILASGADWFTNLRPQLWQTPDGRELSVLRAVAELQGA